MNEGALLLLCCLLVTFIPIQDITFEGNLNKILRGLLKQETIVHKVPEAPRVAVGFGSCVDVFAFDSLPVLQGSYISPPASARHHSLLFSEDDVAETFAYFFQHGAAAERYLHNKKLFKTLVETAKGLPANLSAQFIGGNAPVMANRLAHEGCQVLLAAKISSEQAKRLHPSLMYVPVINATKVGQVTEDVHLVLEYGVGDCWGAYCSPRANRFIVHNDYSNMMLETLTGFDKALLDFSPHMLVVSGLQMLDNFPYDIAIRTKRFEALEQLLVTQNKSVKIHFEMASISEETLLKDIFQYVVPYVDSLGMNEQELSILHNMAIHGNLSHVSDSNPRIASTLDLMRSLYRELHRRNVDGQRPVTRIHVHTLAYQVVMTTVGSMWRNTRAAAAKASLRANKHVCNTPKINTRNSKLIMDESFSVSLKSNSQRVPLIEDSPVSCWYEADIKICVAPNLVCTAVHQTAGAGDNISAAGLSIQI